MLDHIEKQDGAGEAQEEARLVVASSLLPAGLGLGLSSSPS